MVIILQYYLQILQFLSTPPSHIAPVESSNEPDPNSLPTLFSKTSLNILMPPKPKNELANEEDLEETLFKSFEVELLVKMELLKSNELTSLSTMESTAEALQLAVGSNDWVIFKSNELIAELPAVVTMPDINEESELAVFKILGAKSSRFAI